MILERILSILIGYAFGLFQTGFFYGKLKKVDIRKHGSGNAGTTNTLRTFGVIGGIITLAGDLIKPIVAMLLVQYLFKSSYSDGIFVLMQYAGFGAVLGHNYPFYLKFKGGKGIACTGGYIIKFCPLMVPVSLTMFISSIILTKYVSVGSILVVLSYYVQLIVFGQLGLLPVPNGYLIEIYIVGALFVFLGLYQHRANIGRLFRNEERKICFTKNGEL